MVTEYMVLDRFEEETGSMPLLNTAKAPKNARGRPYKVNGRVAMGCDSHCDHAARLTSARAAA
jgi:hypothetical protein